METEDDDDGFLPWFSTLKCALKRDVIVNSVINISVHVRYAELEIVTSLIIIAWHWT